MTYYWTLLILYFTISHLVSFLCSLLEATLLSTSTAYSLEIAKSNPELSRQLRGLKQKIDEPLAAILTFNTTAHTVGAAGIGATVEVLYGDFYVTLSAMIVTLTMLYLTEMIPKTIGALYWKRLVPFAVPVIRFMIVAAYPFVLSFNRFSSWLRRGKEEDGVTESEVKSLIEEGTEIGIFEIGEQKMLFRLFKLFDMRVRDFMLPRQLVPWVDINDSPEKVRSEIGKESSSIFFVVDKSSDNPLGFIYVSDLARQLMEGKEIDLRLLIRSPCYIPETSSLFSLLELLHEHGEKVSFVLDEYGGVAGVVRLEEVFAEMVRDICSSMHIKSPELKAVGDGWLVDGALSLAELFASLGIELPSELASSGYHTAAGLCLYLLDEVPRGGEEFSFQGYRFRIVEMDRQRIQKIAIS